MKRGVLILFLHLLFRFISASKRCFDIPDAENEIEEAESFTKRRKNLAVTDFNDDTFIALPCGHGNTVGFIDDAFTESSFYICKACGHVLDFFEFAFILSFKSVPDWITWNDSYLDSMTPLSNFATKLNYGHLPVAMSIIKNLLAMKIPLYQVQLDAQPRGRYPYVVFGTEKYQSKLFFDPNNVGTESGLSANHEILFCITENGYNKLAHDEIVKLESADIFRSDKTALLHLAIKSNNTEALKVLLDKGADPKIESEAHGMPLHAAIAYRSKEALQLLLERDVDPNMIDSQGIHPLFWAVMNDYHEDIELLVKHGASKKIFLDKKPYGLVHYAVINQKFRTAKLLLSLGFDIERADGSQSSLLHMPVIFSDFDLTAALMVAGAQIDAPMDDDFLEFITSEPLSVNIKLSEDDPAAVIAVLQFDYKILKHFLMNGFNPNTPVCHPRTTLLHISCMLELTDISMLLVRYGADLEAVNDENMKPLDVIPTRNLRLFQIIVGEHQCYEEKSRINGGKPMTAEEFSNLGTENKIIDYELRPSELAKVFLSGSDYFRTVYLDPAEIFLSCGLFFEQFLWFEVVLKGSKAVLEKLFKQLKHFNFVRFGNTSPIHFTISQGDLIWFERLLEKRAKVDFESDLFGLPLHFAIKINHSWIVEKILNYGANPNLHDKFGNLPITVAIKQRSLSIVKLLFRYGAAEIVFSGNEGFSLLHMAIFSAAEDVVLFFIHSGFKFKLRDGQTCFLLHGLVNFKNTEILEIAFEHGANINEPFHPSLYEHFVSIFPELKDQIRLEDPAAVVAIHQNSLAAIKVLLKNGLDPNMLVLNYQIPLLELALLLNRKEIYSVLLESNLNLHHPG